MVSGPVIIIIVPIVVPFHLPLIAIACEFSPDLFASPSNVIAVSPALVIVSVESSHAKVDAPPMVSVPVPTAIWSVAIEPAIPDVI